MGADTHGEPNYDNAAKAIRKLRHMDDQDIDEQNEIILVEKSHDLPECKGEWKNDCPYPECLCAKKVLKENLAEKLSSFETLAWKLWEDDAKTNPMAVNPHAFTYGIKCFVSHMIKSNDLFSLKEVEDLLFKHYMEVHNFKHETLSEFTKDEIEWFSRKLIQDWLGNQFKK